MLLAGLDGIEKGLDPGAPSDYDLFEDAGADVPQVPGSLAESLDALEADHEFLLKGGVFSEGLIRTWIDWKRENEVDFVRLRPHPRGVLALLRRLATGGKPCFLREPRASCSRLAKAKVIRSGRPITTLA